jgi:hypothetical protein
MPGLVIQGFFPRGIKVPEQLPAHLSRLPVHGGQPLPADVRQRMESAFGQDFAQVRVHVGPHVRPTGALAFTQGTNIHFAPGQYNPSTPQGRQMLAHELAHVVQQRTGRVQNPFGSGTAVVHDQRLEAEAERLAQRVVLQSAAQPPPSVQQPKIQQPKVTNPLPAHQAPVNPNSAQPGIAQPYSVVPNDRIHTKMPAKRPWFGYPFVVRGKGASFEAQQQNKLKNGNEYLRRTGTDNVNVKEPGWSTLSLRVSDDGNMAIEDSDLTNRQPKTFYATAAVIAASNQKLNEVGSIVTLQQSAEAIRVVTGWRGEPKVLYRVVPQFSAPPQQNCNNIAEQVTGAFLDARGPTALMTTVHRLFDGQKGDNLERAEDYVGIANNAPGRLRRLGANEHARAGVGEAYMIASLGKPEKQKGKFAWIRDLRTNELRKIGWPYHYGGVIAKSGHDTITLENYARGDNRKNQYDPRWYFQMYGRSSGQSFHAQHAQNGQHSNAITVVARQEDEEIPRLPIWWPTEPITIM